MGMIQNIIEEKINEMSGISELEKKVIMKMYKTGRVSTADLVKASENSEYCEYVKKLCEKEVKENYLCDAGENDGYRNVRLVEKQSSMYKPINAGIFWDDIKTKNGYVLQRNNVNGRYRILDKDGYWCGSGHEEIRKRFESL